MALWTKPLRDLPTIFEGCSDVLLIDGDIVAYRFAVLNEEKIDWGDGTATTKLDIDRAVTEAGNFITWLIRQTGCDDYILLFTGRNNFRKREFPDYKSNRKPADKPEMLDTLKERLQDSWRSLLRDDLEADDLMGILGTHPALRGRCTIATIDKDLDQIPGWHYNWNHKRTYKVEEPDGIMFFWEQVLKGDPTDGYKGAEGIGPVKARKILEGNTDSPSTYFQAVYTAYISRGHDLAYLISQARCALMLTTDHYNWELDEPIMWQPPEPRYNEKGVLPGKDITNE